MEQAVVFEYALAAYLGFALLATIKCGSLALLAGVAAQQGVVDGWLVGVAIVVSGVLADELRYVVGATCGPRLMRRMPSLDRRVRRVAPLLGRYADPLVLSYRFLKSARLVGSFAAGLMRIERSRFSLLNLAGAVIWAGFWIPIGFAAGHALGPYAALLALVSFVLVAAAGGCWVALTRGKALAG